MRDAWRNVVMLLAGERFAICLLPAVFSRAAVLGEKATTAENMRCDDANRDATKATEPGAGTHHKASQAPGRSVHIAVARFRSSAAHGLSSCPRPFGHSCDGADGRDDTTGAADTDCRRLAGCWAGSRRGSHAYEGHQSGAIAYDAGL